MSRSPSTPGPIGRFAPSPTGDLHFGSLVAAVASYLEAKAGGGQWLLRIDDIDPPREVAGSADRILRDLDGFGLVSDAPVLYQSSRTAAYRKAVDQLLDRGLAFHCGCSRAELPSSGIYPGTCRDGLPAGRVARSVRLRVRPEPVCFVDRIQGPVSERLDRTVGDFVIWRADQLPAYQLAVVVDDAYQQITEVVRGADLLDSTARQVYLQNCLDLPTPTYAHHPVALDSDGQKLSKRLRSDPVARLSPAASLEQALHFLGQPCESGMTLHALWDWALEHWRLANVPRVRQLPLATDPPR
jgi:glutamyl-Q tRNA(Asp) synthetase